MTIQKDIDITFEYCRRAAVERFDPNLSNIKYSEYDDLDYVAKFNLGLAAFDLWPSQSRIEWEKRIWKTHYGFYYAMAFGTAAIKNQNPEFRNSIAEHLHKKMINDLDGQVDFSPFNHIGRLMYIASYNIHSIGIKDQDENNSLITSWWYNLDEYWRSVLTPDDTSNYAPNELEALAKSAEVYRQFGRLISASSYFLKGNMESLGDFLEGADEAIAYVSSIRDSKLNEVGDEKIICDDIISSLEELKREASEKRDQYFATLGAAIEEMKEQVKNGDLK